MATDFAVELKALGNTLSDFNIKKEPLTELSKLELWVRQLRDDPDEIPEDQRGMILNALPFFINSILVAKNFTEAGAELAGEILSHVMLMLPKHYTHNKYLEALRLVGDPEKAFYQLIAQDDRTGSWTVPPEPISDPFLEWRNSLIQGQWIDAVIVDPEHDRKCWARAQIIEIQLENKILLEFEDQSSIFDRQLNIYSQEIAPFRTYSNDDGWRDELDLGSFVDAFDTASTWYNCTVLEKRIITNDRGKAVTEAKIAYRIYEPDGEKFDEIGNFRGWSNKYDEFINIRSPRLAPFNTVARKWPIPTPQCLEENVIEDSNDFIIREPYAFAVTRPDRFKSFFIVRNLNRFGLAGGFRWILEKLDISQEICNFELMFSLISFLGRNYAYYHKKFAMEYVPKLKQTFISYFLDSPQTLIREFNREKISIMINIMEFLLKRVHTIPEKISIIEDFHLKLSLKCFECPYLEKRIQGLKGILESIKSFRYPNWQTNSSNPLVHWILKNNIITGIFGAKGHHQLIQRSTDILRLLSNENSLTEEHLEVIWSATERSDDESKMSVYKVVGEASSGMKPENLDFMVQKISCIPANKLIKPELELIHELTKYPLRAGIATNRACDFLWKVAISQEDYSDEVKDMSLEHFCNLMKSWELRKNRLTVMIQCVDKIRENISTVQCLKVIKKLLVNFGIQVTATDPLTRDAVIEILIQQHEILTAFFDNLKYFKQIAAQVSSKLTNSEVLADMLVADRTTYKENIEERLNFLHTFLSSSSHFTLTQSQMDALWDSLLKNALCSAEKDCFMKWLSEVTESQSQGKKIFDDSDVFEFFREKVGNPSNDYQTITSEGFKVFKSYFLLVNVSLQKLLQFPKFNIYSNSSYSIYPTVPNNYASDNQPKELDYTVIVPPYELEGMECLRKLLFEVQNDKVLEQSFEFFIMMYDCSNIQKIEDLIQIRKEYIEYLLSHIKESSDITYRTRALYLLRNFMEECEKEGTAGLKSHGAMLKGDLHNIIVLNQVSYYPSKPEIHKKLEFKLPSNTTFWELRCLISNQVKLLPDEFRLTRSFPHKDIKDSENGKTLNDLRIRPTETLVVYKRSSNLPKASLLDSEQNLLPQPKAIFTSMFYKFADTENRMSSEGCAAFTNSCTGDQCKATDRRIQDFFTNYDDDIDGYLTLDNFLEFYRQACLNRISTVWSNLYAYHYNNELRSYLDIDNGRIQVQTIPGYIITQSKQHFDLIFEILNIPELANEAWNLVVKLPTNAEIYEKLLKLDDNWHSLFDPSSKHRLLYSLQIIESFMEDVQEDSPEMIETHREWKRNFLMKGGFQSLYNILLEIKDTRSTFDKNCLGFVLKLLSVFILAAFSASRPDIYEVVELVRQSSGGVNESPTEPMSESPTQTNDKNIQFNEGENQPTDSAAGYSEYQPQGPVNVDQQMMLDQLVSTKPEEEQQTVSKYTESKVFKDLVNEVMLHNLSDEIINSIDFKQLITRLIDLIGDTLQDTEYENEDRHIIDSALELWVSCLLHKNDLIEAVYNIEHGMSVDEFTMRGITYPKTILVRKAFGQSLNQICQKVEYPSQMPRPFFLRLLLKNMPKGQEESKETEWAQFFELLSTLVENDVSDPSIDYKELTSALLNQILEHPYTEKRNAYYSDKILVGLLVLAEKIFSNIPELKDMAYQQNFTKNAFFSLLFSPAKNLQDLRYDAETAQDQGHFEPPKCKAKDTRAAAYKLISTLVRGHSDNLNEILEGLICIRQKIKPVTNWNYSPSSDMRSVHGYGGIVNLGCICYMNSMLQQFYMIPQFRYSILEVDDFKHPTNSAYLEGEEVDKSVPGYEIDDNMLHQFQRLYSFLELTDRQAYNPRPFTFAFKDHSGHPTNISIQSDAQEFLQMLFDRLERATKETSHKYLVQSIFGGKNISQLICSECKAVKENIEDLYNISLDVKHSKNIYESLQRYITGDMIEGYHCESCEKQVNVNKRTLIGQLPNIMICHLQRIIFNFDTFANEKINSRFEFPHTLNLEAYTKEGLERKEKQEEDMQVDTNPEDYEYELSGIVVHTGTADAGHYYSYIRIDKEKWLEFNDTTVRSYNHENIERDCFGGSQECADDITVGFMKSFRDSSLNAYMLVYEKKQKGTIKLVNNPVLEGDSATSPRNEEIIQREFHDVHKVIPNNIYKEVMIDNENFMFERHLYSSEFFNFFVEVVQSASDSEVDLSEPATFFAVDVMAHAYQSRQLSSLTTVLKQLLMQHPDSTVRIIKQLLDDKLYTVCQLLLVCSVGSTREIFSNLFSFLLNFMVDYEVKEYGLYLSSECLSTQFIDGLLNMIPQECAKHWSRFLYFWQVIRDFAAAGELQVKYLMEKEAIAQFIDFYLGPSSPLAQPGDKRNTFGSKQWPPQFDALISTLSILVLKCSTAYREGTYEMSAKDRLCIMEPEFYDKTLRGGWDGKSLGKIIAHLSYEDEEYSRMIAQVVLKGLNEIEYEDVKSYYQVLEEYLTIQDSLIQHRIEWIMGFPVPSKILRIVGKPASFGAAMIQSIEDEVTSYVTTLSFGSSSYDTTESILSLIWRNKRRWDYYCILSIKNLFTIALKNKFLMDYLHHLPPPTYQYARYYDWIEEYIESYRSYTSSWNTSYSSKDNTTSTVKKEDDGDETLRIYKEFREKSGPPAEYLYVVGDTVKQQLVECRDIENVKVSVYIYTTKFGRSQPDGKRNHTLPSKMLKNEAPVRPYSSYRQSYLTVDTKDNDTYRSETYDNNKQTNNGTTSRYNNTYLTQKLADEEYEEENTDIIPLGSETIPMVDVDMDSARAKQYLDDGNTTKTVNKPTVNYEMEQFSTKILEEEEHKESEHMDTELETELFEEGETIIRFEVWNRDSDPARVMLSFEQFGDGNYLSPASPVISEISPYATKDIVTILKKNPYQPWQNLQYKFDVKVMPKVNRDYYIEPPMQADVRSIEISELKSLEEEAQAPPGMKTCKACTLHNFESCFRCDACGSLLD